MTRVRGSSDQCTCSLQPRRSVCQPLVCSTTTVLVLRVQTKFTTVLVLFPSNRTHYLSHNCRPYAASRLRDLGQHVMCDVQKRVVFGRPFVSFYATLSSLVVLLSCCRAGLLAKMHHAVSPSTVDRLRHQKNDGEMGQKCAEQAPSTDSKMANRKRSDRRLERNVDFVECRPVKSDFNTPELYCPSLSVSVSATVSASSASPTCTSSDCTQTHSKTMQ